MHPDDRCDVNIIHDDLLRQALAATVDGLTATRAAELFAALGDPSRVRLISALLGGELCVCDVAAAVGLSESAVSHQLRLLRGRRLVRPRRAGRMVFYAIDDQHIMDLFAQGRRHVEEPAGPGPAATPAEA